MLFRSLAESMNAPFFDAAEGERDIETHLWMLDRVTTSMALLERFVEAGVGTTDGVDAIVASWFPCWCRVDSLGMFRYRVVCELCGWSLLVWGRGPAEERAVHHHLHARCQPS